MAETKGTIKSQIIIDTTQVATANKDLTDIKKTLTDIAANTKGALANEFKSIGTAADDVVKKISAIKTVEQELEAQISRTKRAYQLANDTDAVDKLASRRKISQEKAQSIYDNARESRATKLQAITAKIMDGEIALGKTYAKNISLMEQSKKILESSGKDTGNIDVYTRGLRVDQKAFNATTAIPKDPKIETLNSSQYTDGIKQAKQTIAALNRQIFEQEQKSNGVITQRTQELRNQRDILDAQVKSIKTVKPVEDTKPTKDISAPYVNLQSQIRKAASEAERLWLIQNKDKGVGGSNVTAYNDARTSLAGLVATQEKYSASLGKSSSLLDGFGRRVKSHLEWMTSGLLIGAAFAIPIEYINAIKEIEVKMAGMAQVLPSLHGDHEKLNEVSREFVGIAQQYGESVSGVIEAGKLWGRAYKDIPTLMAFTSASAKLAVADNFSLAESNKALEATLAQYQWRATSAAEATAYSMRVVDTWTAVAHNAQVSASDLAQANERTAGVARMVGVEFEFLQAVIAAGVKNTGRSGAEIGNTLKSVFGSIHSDKAVKEIEALGVAMKTTSADGTQTWRKVQDVMVDLAIATRATTKDVEGLFKAAAGGEPQLAA